MISSGEFTSRWRSSDAEALWIARYRATSPYPPVIGELGANNGNTAERGVWAAFPLGPRNGHVATNFERTGQWTACEIWDASAGRAVVASMGLGGCRVATRMTEADTYFLVVANLQNRPVRYNLGVHVTSLEELGKEFLGSRVPLDERGALRVNVSNGRDALIPVNVGHEVTGKGSVGAVRYAVKAR